MIISSCQREMIEKQLKPRGIKDSRVLKAFKQVDRKDFVPDDFKHLSYADRPIEIGEGQTVSQPYLVAYMLQVLDLKKSDKVLEVGTGSLFNTALLSKLVRKVYSVEVLEILHKRALKIKQRFGLDNVEIKLGDGMLGWPEEAPFDVIILTAAPNDVPKLLTEQLGENGRMLLPVGKGVQILKLITKKDGELDFTDLDSVQFVPVTRGEVRLPSL